MIQVIYIRYMQVYVKGFSGEEEKEDALSFIDHLRNELFDGGVIVGIIASEWRKTQVGDRAVRVIVGRLWLDQDRSPDPRIDEFIEHEFEQPCQHCDHWCEGTCRGSKRCLQAGKPGHTRCKSKLIEEGVLTRRKF